jgi:hypothetical protein
MKLHQMIRISVGMGCVALSLCMISTSLHAQEKEKSTATRTRNVPLTTLLRQMSEESGVTVLGDSTVGSLTAPPLKEATTRENLETQLQALMRTLPAGTEWAKIYLPIPEQGKKYQPDAITQLIRSQINLFGKPSMLPKGTVEIQGKRMSEKDAEAYIKGLNLAPYYVISNRNSTASATGALGGNKKGLMVGVGDMMDNLMKQLGVTNPKDIPAGRYKVPMTGPDGNPVDTDVIVDREGDKVRISVMANGNIPPM